jgi:hypothetical protein
MPDSRRRIIVDGLEPGALVRFPLILRTIASAFQPPRVIVGLLVVLALVLPGRAWDAFRGPRLAPGELLHGRDAEAGARELAVRREVLARWAPLVAVRPVDDDDDAAAHAAVEDAIAALDRGFEAWRERSAGAGTGAGNDDASGVAERNGAADAAPSVPGSPGGAVRLPVDARGEAAGRAVTPGADDRSESQYRADRVALVVQRRQGEFAAVEAAVHEAVRSIGAGLVLLEPARAWSGVRQLFVDLPVGAWSHARLMAAFLTPWTLAIWALGGGALSRMAATFIGRGERATVISAFRFARRAWGSLLLAPLVPLAAAALALLPAGLIGLLLHVPGLNIFGGLLYGPALVAAVIAAVLLLGLGLGAPLVTAVIAAERCDAIDAAQRPYALLLRRPVHLVAYVGLAIIAAAVTDVVARGVASVALDLAAHAAAISGAAPALAGAGAPPMFAAAPPAGPGTVDGGLGGLGAGLIAFWRDALLLLAAAAVVSAWASATTAAYLLLRQTVDGQDPEEIWEEGMVPGTFARRAPTPKGDHGVAPPRPRHAGPPSKPGIEAGTSAGLPDAAAEAAREEAAREATERVGDEELSEVLSDPDLPAPSTTDLLQSLPGDDAADTPDTSDAADAPSGTNAGGERDGSDEEPRRRDDTSAG